MMSNRKINGKQPKPFKFRDGYRAQVTDPATGKRPTKYFKTKAEAQQWINEMFHHCKLSSNGRLGGPEACSFAELLVEYARTETVKKSGLVQEINRINVYLASAGFNRLKAIEVGNTVKLELHKDRGSSTGHGQKKLTDEQIALLDQKADMAKRTCSEIGRNDVSLLMSQMQACGLSASTIQKEIALLRAIFNTAIKDWEWSGFENPAADFSLGKSNVMIPSCSSEQLKALIQEARKHPYPLIGLCVEFGLETGIRKGALLNLTWDRVDLENGACKVPCKQAKTKGLELMSIPLTERAVEILQELKKQQGPELSVRVFNALSPDELRNAFEKIRLKADVPKLTFHGLRHLTATTHAKKGLNAHLISSALGHKTILMSQIYVNLNSPDVKRFIDEKVGESVFSAATPDCHGHST